LEQLQDAVHDRWIRPLLVTGEPGAGKTWLADRLVDELPSGWRAVSIEVTTSLDALEFLRLIADALGLPMTERVGVARLRIRAALEDDSRDGRSWLLILDDVPRASSVVWEEIDRLAGSLGRPDGFAALLLLARTEFIRELAPRRLEGSAVHTSVHLHLMPLDLDEALDLLRLERGLGVGDEGVPFLEELHRDALGNPRMLIQLAELRTRRFGRRKGAGSAKAPGWRTGLPRSSDRSGARTAHGVRMPEQSLPGDASEAALQQASTSKSPSLLPTKPPIRLEEGLVEVGWDGDLEAEPTRSEESHNQAEALSSSEPELDDQVVDDRYAALQAWTEWSRNRERSERPEGRLEDHASASPEPASPDTEIREETPSAPDSFPPARIRPGAPHDFAPYSQLFSRIRQSKQG
jgi:general secretion pathway protein A